MVCEGGECEDEECEERKRLKIGRDYRRSGNFRR